MASELHLGDSNWKFFQVGYPVDTPTNIRFADRLTFTLRQTDIHTKVCRQTDTKWFADRLTLTIRFAERLTTKALQTD